MFTPAMIHKMWKRLDERFGLGKNKGKDKKALPRTKKAEETDKQVEKNLLVLRTLARGDLTDANTAAKFLKRRDTTAKPMRKYCKLLKGNDLKESVQDLPKFRKAVKQLTVLVESLTAGPLPEVAEGDEPDLNALDKVETSALDQDMEDPNFGEYSEEELVEAEAEEKKEEPGFAPAKTELGGPGSLPPPQKLLAATFKTRLQTLAPRYQLALNAGVSNRGPLELAMRLAVAAARNRDFEQGLTQLDKLEAELGNANRTAADPKANADRVRWTARRQAIEQPYLKALKEQPANANKLRVVLGFADGKAEARDFASALKSLESLEKLLPAPTETNGTATAALQQWQVACAEVKNQLRKVETEIVKAKDVNSTQAVIRLESVIKNLARQPSTRQDVLALESWVRDDEVITRAEQPNPWGIPVKVRDRLLPVLAILKQQLQA